MPKLVNAPYVNYVKGLITEASELTFPDNSSVDELNCELFRDGSRARRLGLDVEANTSPSTETYSTDSLVRTLSWENVGGEERVEFSVVQIGNKLRFYDKSSEFLSDGIVTTTKSSSTPYIVDMVPYARPSGNGAGFAPVQVTSVKGALVVVSPEINSFYIQRNIVTGAFTEVEIPFKERDFEFLGDTSTYFKSITYANRGVLRDYDQRNCGWREFTTQDDGSKELDSTAPLTVYRNSTNNAPSLNIPWFQGKDSNDNFSVTEFDKLAGEETTSLIGNGRFVLNLYEGNRSEASGISDASLNEPEDSRFSCVTSFGSRVFYAGCNSSKRTPRVYFTQVISELDALGKLHAQNDPTAEFFNDALATDGGFISIQEAYGIRQMYAIGSALYIFAENGVWSITGVDDRFDPTEFVVNKVFDVGIFSPESFAVLEGTPFWWSNEGIFSLGKSQLGDTIPQNISIGSIQTFWSNIPEDSKVNVVSQVDLREKRIFWFYKTKDEDLEYKFNEVLIYDGVLQAFYPWRVQDKDESTPFVVGSSFYRNAAGASVEFNVVDSDGNQVVTSSGDPVVSTVTSTITGSRSAIKVLVMNSNGSLQWGEFLKEDFRDWGENDPGSFLESRHDNFGDISLQKTAMYLLSYLKVTETGFEEVSGEYFPVRPSSCKASVYWDFRTSPSGTPQQAYRLRYLPVIDEDDLSVFNYPQEVITSRLRMRGRGRNMRLRFDSEEGKDFHLVGWNVVGAVDDQL